MKIENLTEGQVIKNYKELCKVLDIEEQQGNSKITQMKELERYFEIEKNGHSIKILKIYENVSERKIETSFSNRSLYIGNFSVQLLNTLAKDFREKKAKGIAHDGSNYMFITPRELFKMTGMINENYRFTRFAVKDFIENNTTQMITDFDIDEFFKSTSKKMYSITKTSLDTLSKRLLIKYDPRHIFEFEDKKYVSNDEQEMMIRTAQLKIYDEMFEEGKFEKMERTNKQGERVDVAILSQVHLSKYFEEFYKRVNKKIENEYHWTNVYSGWKINFDTEFLEEKIKYYEREVEDISSNKLVLNDKLASFINNSASKRYQKNKYKYEKYLNEIISQLPRFNPMFAYEEHFVKSQALLVDMFIKLDTEYKNNYPKKNTSQQSTV